MKLTKFSLSVLGLAMSASVFAQAPTTTAPAPGQNAELVKSAYSDAYTQFTKWDYQHGATKEDLTIGSDNILHLTCGESSNYAEFSLGSRNLGDMEYVHADVFAPVSNGVDAIELGVGQFSGNFRFSEVKPLTPGQWVSVDIPLSAYSGYNFSAAETFRFRMTRNSGGNEVYVDNVYFYTSAAPTYDMPTSTAPKPQVDASKVGSCFSDVYENIFQFTPVDGKTKGEFQVVNLTENDKVLRMNAFTYAHFGLGSADGTVGVDVSDYEYLHFDVYKPTKSTFGAAIQPGLNSGTAQYSGEYSLTPGEWVSVDVKMSDFANANLSAIITMLLKDKSNATNGLLYVDNVFFYKGDKVDPLPGEDLGGEDTPTTPVEFSILPAPAPTNATTDVKSIFSDKYTTFANYPYDSGKNNPVEEIEVNGDKMYKFTAFNYAIFKAENGSADVSDMDYLHFDVAVPNATAGKPIPKIQPVLVSAGTSQYSGTYNLEPGKWNSINVKVADFTAKGLDATKLTEIRFKHNGSASDDGDVIIDNIYFAKEAGNTGTTDNEWGTASTGGNDDPSTGNEENIPAAPKPTHAQDDVKAFFSDAYTLTGKFEIPTNEEYDKNGLIEIINIGTADAKDEVAKITNLNWRVVNLGQRDVSDKGYLHVDYYSPVENGVTSVCINLTNWDTKNGSAYDLDGDAQNYRVLTPGQWTSFDIPLNNFHSSDPSKEFNFATDMACVRFYAGDGSRGKTLYVDNFYFWGQPQEDEGGNDGEVYEPIQDDSDGDLPSMDTPMLGVNLASASGGSVPGRFGTDYMYPRFEDLYYFKAKGVRLIRLPFRAARVAEDITNPTTLDTEDLNALKAVVAEAERLGMWVFLDAHDYAERTTNGTQDLLGTGEYTIDRFGKMWGAIAKEFVGYSNIWGYDLQNEPKVSAPVLVQAYQAAIDEIRKVDTNAQIIVEGTNWASAYEWIYGDREDKQYPDYSTEVAWSYKANSPWLLAGLKDPQNKIVFEAHGYFDQDNSGTYSKGYQNVNYRNRFLPFLEWCSTNNVKGLIGEFGVPYNEHATGDERYMEVLDGALQLFRDYNMNATYWCAGAMYEGNSLTCQPDKSPLHGNYAKEKSTMKVLEQYFTNWAEDNGNGNGSSGVEAVETTLNDGKIYNVMGIEVGEDYKGIVIINGKKYIKK